LLTVAAGGLAVAHQAQTEILAVHIGASAPLIIAAFTSSAADKETKACDGNPQGQGSGRGPPSY
jgi:hypothetical protein